MLELKYALNEDKQIIDISTGEIITKAKYTKEMKQWIEDTYGIYALSNISLSCGIEYKLQKILNREYVVGNPKENYTFVKVFKVEVRDIMNNTKGFDELNVYEKATIATFESHLSFPDNSVVIDGESPTFDTLLKVIGIGKTKYREVISSLEKKGLLKQKNLLGRNVIYLNPYLYSVGLVHKETMDMFEDSIYNPTNKKNKD